MNKLFADDWGVNNDPVDKTEIKVTLLYYDVDELKLFKSLCKKGMQVEYGEKRFDSNIADFLLKILKEKYDNL